MCCHFKGLLWYQSLAKSADFSQHRKSGKRETVLVKDRLANKLGLDTRITTLGHVQKGGSACAYDRVLATMQGVMAISAVLEARPETLTSLNFYH